MKAQLFILGGRDVGRSFDIEEQAFLGRAPECEVRLRDRSISRKHAVVRLTDAGWVVEDLGSRNGLRFQDERVPEIRLADLDEFMLGDLPVRFRLPDAVEAAPPPLVAEAAAAAAPAPLVEPEVEPEDEIRLEDEIVLEDEIDLTAPADTIASRRAPARREPVRVEPAPEPAVAELSEYERRRAQLLRDNRSQSFLRGDLSQRPFWFKALVGLLLTGLALGLAFLAFRLMQMLRGTP